jgi:ProP effector
MSERVHRSTSDLLQTIDLLADLFPQCFFVYERRRLPLKVGIFQDLLNTGCFAGLEDDLKIALRRYTGNQQYQRKLKAGATRIDLNGEAAGTVSEDQAQGATKLIAWRARKAAQKVAQKAPETTIGEAEAGVPRRSTRRCSRPEGNERGRPMSNHHPIDYSDNPPAVTLGDGLQLSQRRNGE